MKRKLTVYGVVWAICLGIFNVITFATPNEINGVSKFDPTFWIGYVFVTLAFIAQLACAYFALKAEGLKRFFYNIPLIHISYVCVGTMVVVGGCVMALPSITEWVAVIACAVALGLNIIAIIKSASVAEAVVAVDENIANATSFMKRLTVDAQILASGVSSDELRSVANEVFEVIRYSDPMSCDELCEVEGEIKNLFSEFSDSVNTADAELARANAEALIFKINERNLKCKLFK